MAEYTYKDIIIDPTSEEAKNAVGKKCFVSNIPISCLEHANENDYDFLTKLNSINLNLENPFNVKFNGVEHNFNSIIVKKEEPKPRFIPFSNKIEFIVKFNSCTTRDDLTPYKYVLLKYGMWLEEKATGSYYMVTELFGDGVVIGDRKMETTNEGDDEYVTINKATSWEELLRDYCFIDGSPCGKEVEE